MGTQSQIPSEEKGTVKVIGKAFDSFCLCETRLKHWTQILKHGWNVLEKYPHDDKHTGAGKESKEHHHLLSSHSTKYVLFLSRLKGWNSFSNEFGLWCTQLDVNVILLRKNDVKRRKWNSSDWIPFGKSDCWKTSTKLRNNAIQPHTEAMIQSFEQFSRRIMEVIV